MDVKRFKSSEYKRKIQAVRGYKREVNPLPETAWQKFLYFIGLGTVFRRVIFFIFLVFLTYIIYFANFLIIKQPEISGAERGDAEHINNVFQQYKRKFVFIFPQKNILFFSPQRFGSYLQTKHYKVAAVKSIKRKLWNHISIEVVLRVPAYVLQNKENFYILSSDGSIAARANQSEQSKYLMIVDNVDNQINLGEKFYDQKKYGFLSYMVENLPGKIFLQIQQFETSGKLSNDLVIVAQNDIRFYFDNTTDPAKFLDRLFTLWMSITPEQQKKIAYIDLRYDPKAYVCYKTDKCAQKAEPVQEGRPVLEPVLEQKETKNSGKNPVKK